MSIKDAYDLASLAEKLGCSAQQLGYYIYKRDLNSQYKRFKIKKRSDATREIKAPSTNLKLIQKSLAHELSQLLRFRSSVTGFIKGRDIKRNALMHVGQRHVLNIDLKDFFGTINYGRVFGLLSKSPHNISSKVAAAIAKACTLDNALPQGAPTSPVLSNLICAKMDAELSRFAAANKCVYSRYADDMTFSTNRHFMPLAAIALNTEGHPKTEISKNLRDIIESNGFVINEEKSRLTSKGRRQIVTGLIVNKRVNVRRTFVREIRAMLHSWRKHGLDNASKYFNESYSGYNSDFESALRGKISFIGQIRGRPDAVFKKLADQFNALSTGGKIRTQIIGLELVGQAVWVLENEDGQGSAFFLQGVGIVSCAHCTGKNNILYHHLNHSAKFSVKVIWKDEDRDLAVFSIPVELEQVLSLPLTIANGLINGSDIVLAGYPNHSGATPLRVESGKLIRSFPRFGVSYLEISSKIIEGNSGGPVLNEKHEVIGVAVKGVSGPINLSAAEFLAISATELGVYTKLSKSI